MVDPSKVKNYEIDLKRGYIKTDGTKEDNEQALLALGCWTSWGIWCLPAESFAMLP